MDRARSIGLACAVFVAVVSELYFAQKSAQAQDVKQPPVAEQKVERPKFDYERVGVYECQGLSRLYSPDILTMRFSLLSKNAEFFETVSVAPWRLQIGVHKEAVGTELSYDIYLGASLLELPTEEAAAQWRAYLETVRRECLYVTYSEKIEFQFVNGTGTFLVIDDAHSHKIPAVPGGFGIIRRVRTELDNIKVVIEKGIKTHAVVEWGKAFVDELRGESSNGERHYNLDAPNITLYVPDSATQEAWQARITTERRKFAPRLVLPPTEVK